VLFHSDYTKFVKKTATELGFDYCGIAEAKRLEEDEKRLSQWLSKGYQGTMQYMENHFELRIDPTKLVPGARSVITLLLNYFPAQQQTNTQPRISKYAYGQDYHTVIREKLTTFLARLREKIGPIQGRGFVDSAPVLERSWAQRAGLGWVGKNGNLIHKQAGSFFFIATLITDLFLEWDDPMHKDYCGSCTRCIDACPTEAILPNKVIDGSKCISYYTIELKHQLSPALEKGQLEGWLFGCDTCQDVCPWNRFSKPHTTEAFKPLPLLFHLDAAAWEELTEESFKNIFSTSPLQRTRYEGIRRNLKLLRDTSDPTFERS
jgi:epoxyqueuosine reductase